MRKIVWATFKRQIVVNLFKQRTLEYLEKHRKGNYVSCGVCCQYIRRCPYLTSENKCTINGKKHLICIESTLFLTLMSGWFLKYLKRNVDILLINNRVRLPVTQMEVCI
jgi:hypothetical protein